MNVLYYLLFLSLLYSSFSFSFQSDFESVSYLDTSKATSSTREMYNAPYSLCIKDRIPPGLCGKMSLEFGGETFKTAYYLESLTKENREYFRMVSLTQAQLMIYNYFLAPTSIPNEFSYPKLGQLKHLIEHGFILKITGHPYWYVRDDGRTIEITYYGGRPSTGDSVTTSKAMLSRLVTKEYPSSCKEAECTGFYNNQDWILQTANNSAFTTRYYYGYSINGKSYEWDLSGQKKLAIPSNAVGVWLSIWHAGMLGYVAQLKNLENEIGTSDILCVKIFGTLVINHYEIYRNKCW